MKRTTTEDIMGDFGYRLVWSVQDHWADVIAYKVASRDQNWVPQFVIEVSDLEEQSPSLEGAEKHLDGYVKWDGCSEFKFGHLHLCGPDGYKEHFELLQHIYHRAFQLMGREPEYPWK